MPKVPLIWNNAPLWPKVLLIWNKAPLLPLYPALFFQTGDSVNLLGIRFSPVCPANKFSTVCLILVPVVFMSLFGNAYIHFPISLLVIYVNDAAWFGDKSLVTGSAKPGFRSQLHRLQGSWNKSIQHFIFQFSPLYNERDGTQWTWITKRKQLEHRELNVC